MKSLRIFLLVSMLSDQIVEGKILPKESKMEDPEKPNNIIPAGEIEEDEEEEDEDDFDEDDFDEDDEDFDDEDDDDDE